MLEISEEGLGSLCTMYRLWSLGTYKGAVRNVFKRISTIGERLFQYINSRLSRVKVSGIGVRGITKRRVRE